MKEKLEMKNRFKAELAQGISILCQKLGTSGGKDMPESLTLCDSKIKELLA